MTCRMQLEVDSRYRIKRLVKGCSSSSSNSSSSSKVWVARVTLWISKASFLGQRWRMDDSKADDK